MCFPLIMMFHLPRWKKFLTFIHRYEKNIFLHHRRLVTQRYGRIVHFSPAPIVFVCDFHIIFNNRIVNKRFGWYHWIISRCRIWFIFWLVSKLYWKRCLTTVIFEDHFHPRYLSFWSDITNCSFTNFYENNEWIFHFFTVWCQHFLKGSIVFIFSFLEFVRDDRIRIIVSTLIIVAQSIYSPRFYRLIFSNSWV